MITRREAVKNVAFALGALTMGPYFSRAESGTANSNGITYPFKVPDLGYPYDALEPYIDAETMHLHHDKHNRAYVENLNKAVAGFPELFQKMSVEELLQNVDKVPANAQIQVRNNAGGQYNHTLFWQFLQKDGGTGPRGELAKAIDATFGSYSAFQDKFSEAATKVFGSGWAWLTFDGKKLEITSTANQDSVILKSNERRVPILGIDVWEHAYYLKYRNRRPEYIKAFWNVVSWDYVSERFAAGLKAA